jgi:hypothetical protein
MVIKKLIEKSIYYKIFSKINVLNINNTIYNFISSSSSIIKHPTDNDKYLFIVRNINYKLDKYGNNFFLKNSKNDTNTISINKIFILDEFLEIEKEYFLDFNYRDNIKYNGFEDIRFFNFNNIIYYIGSYYYDNKIKIISDIYNLNDDKLKPTIITPSFPTDNEWEKNWVFFNNNNELNIIYKWKPLYICNIDYNTQQLNLLYENNNVPNFFSKFRGSTCGIEYDNKIWFITHYSKKINDKNSYLHVFIVFDKQMNLIGYSDPFKFNNNLVEYCIGMTLNKKNNFIITFSLLDKTTQLIILSKEFIETLIYKI